MEYRSVIKAKRPRNLYSCPSFCQLATSFVPPLVRASHPSSPLAKGGFRGVARFFAPEHNPLSCSSPTPPRRSVNLSGTSATEVRGSLRN